MIAWTTIETKISLEISQKKKNHNAVSYSVVIRVRKNCKIANLKML